MSLLRRLFGRRSQRFEVAGRVDLGFDGTGTIKNQSASGISFETDVAYDVGSKIDFKIEFDGPAGKSIIHCLGTITRREQRGEGRVGFGVKLDSQRIGTSKGLAGSPQDGG